MRRFPWLTTAVAVVTVVGLVIEQTVPGTLHRLERTPAAWHGEWWRWGTAYVAGGWWVLCTVLLVADRDIHGGTLAVALVVAALRPAGVRPATPAARPAR